MARSRLVIGLTIAIASACVATGATSSTRGGTALPQLTGYPVRALVDIEMKVRWSEYHPRPEDCQAWLFSKGRNWVLAEGIVSGYVGFTALRPAPGQPWAPIALQGKSIEKNDVSFSRRELQETSGVRWGALCIPPMPKPYEIPGNDCEPWGKKKDRQFKVAPGHFSVHASRRKADRWLEELVDSDTEGRHRVFEVTALPGRKWWYRNCRVHRYAPGEPIALAALVTEDDVRALGTLKAGKNYMVEYDTREAGLYRDCEDPRVIGPDAICEGWYRVSILFHRLTSGRDPWPTR